MKNYLNYLTAFCFFNIFYFIFSFDFLSCIAIGVFFYWLSSLIIRANNSLPIKELFLSLYGLQFLFGAALTFNGFDVYNIDMYKMKIDNLNYFYYTIPVFVSFSFGFSFYIKQDTVKVNRESINNWTISNPNVPYYFILIGIIAPSVKLFLPSSLVFVGYLFESFKFIGLFILLISYQKIKPIILSVIYGFIIVSSFTGGMFHDLLTWIIVLGLILAYRYKPNWWVKLLAIFAFTSFAIFIQSIKGGLREKTWTGGEEASLDLIQNVSVQNSIEKGGFFTIENIGPQVNRINQGWILASTIDYVPKNIEHTHGELILTYLYSAILPRILAPDKLNAGSQDVFNKYSGHFIDSGTSMALGLFTDAYIEFGSFGALFYVFAFGLMYGYILKQFFVRSNKYPILILFSVLAFIYPMRPDCETQTVLGHLFKTIMLIFGIFSLFKKSFILNN